MRKDMCALTTEYIESDTTVKVIQSNKEEIPQHAINFLAGFFLKRIWEESLQVV